jgi:phage gpG-like protein
MEARMTRVTLEVFGDKVLSREFLRTGDNADDLTPAWRRVIPYLHSTVADQFASEGGEMSGGWAPLAPSTLARKTGPSILVESGALEESLTGMAPGAIRDVSKDELAFGSSVPYGIHHQRGTSRMPARKVLQFGGRSRHGREVMRIIQAHIFGSGV